MKKKYYIFILLLSTILSAIFFLKPFKKQAENQIATTTKIQQNKITPAHLSSEKSTTVKEDTKMVDIFQQNILSQHRKQVPIEIDQYQYPDPTTEELVDPEKYEAYRQRKYHAKMNALIPTYEVLAQMEERLEALRQDERIDDERFFQAEQQLKGFKRLRERYEDSLH